MMTNAKPSKPPRDEIKDAIVLAASPHVAFDGWGMDALERGARDGGFDANTAKRMFPEGAVDAIKHFANLSDREMLKKMDAMDISSMRIRDRIIAGVRARLEFLTPHREAVRAGLGVLASPLHGAAMAKITASTVDAIWNAAGDKSNDFNWYTKRGLLAAVYSATVLYWLADESEGYADTWDFLARRIDDVLKIPPMKAKLEKAIADLPRRFGFVLPGFGAASNETNRKPT
ncbi:MAG: COQ9 family protein [Rhodospirillaceae bacterium]|nr:COQ9 family protein [Rhodospirillaceae bacterium]